MNLKKIREETGKTQKQVAKDLKINANTLCNYENENTEPKIEMLVKFANYFNVSLDYLCDRPFNQQIGYLNDKQKELAIKISKLNDIQCEQVNAILETLKITTTQETISTIKNYQGE